MAGGSRQFPVLLVQLESSDVGYDAGFRYRIDQVDGESIYTLSRERAEHLIALHGLVPVTLAQMVRRRYQEDPPALRRRRV